MEYIDNSQIKILVVDDEPGLLQITELILRREKYTVFTACNGEECINAVRANKPDLLLLDVMLPDILGFDVCRSIKNDPDLSSIFVILLSATQTMSENISKGLEIGADDYLIKPIKNRELIARVAAAARIISSEKKLKQSKEHLKQFTTGILSVYEEEKTQLATRIDNELNQTLAALKISIGLIKSKLKSRFNLAENDELDLHFVNLQTQVENALNSSVNLMKNLRNEVLYLIGITDAIELYISDIERRYAIKCNFKPAISDITIDKKTENSLFQIFQVIISIIIRKRTVKVIDIELSYRNKKLALKLISNEFNFENELNENSIDLQANNLRERILLLNGNLLIENKLNTEQCIIIEIPYS